MAEVILKNIKKIYPHQEPKKKKKGEPEKKTNLQITEEGVLAVDNFNLHIQDKEFIVLVGPSGCGKSTTLRMVAGLEEISGGELYIGGQLMNDVAPKDRDISMVFQNYALYPHMTVRENIAFPLKLRKMDKAEIDQRVEQAAEILDITEYLDRKPKALSGGQRQRVAIARALITDPEVLLMDEPFSSLDALTRARLQNTVLELWRRRRPTCVLVTHNVEDAVFLGRHIMVLNGRPARKALWLTNPCFGDPDARSREAYFDLTRRVYAALTPPDGPNPASELLDSPEGGPACAR